MSKTWVVPKKFYESVFRISFTQLPTPVPGIEMWAFPMIEEATGCAGTLVKMDGMDPAGLGTIVYFNCDDCSASKHLTIC